MIKKMWCKYGYDPNYLLDENDDFFNILTDFRMTKEQLEAESRMFSHAYEEDAFQAADDAKTYIKLYNIAKNFLCGFYNTREYRYFSPGEISSYADWYLSSIKRGRDKFILYDEYFSKYNAIFSNIAALLIAADVTQYLDEKKICDKNITKSNVDKFLQYGPQAGYIFDPETMEYRKPENFEEFTHHLHTQYWFHDPAKGYHIDAPYKWNPDVPMPEELR